MARIGMIVLLIVAFGGCGKQYSQPQIEPSRRPFPGIASHLLASGGNTVHVLFVHGMCTHTEREWVEGSWRPAIQAVLMAQQINERKTPAADTLSPIQTIDKTFDIVGGRKLEARFLLWSALTADDKKTLLYDRVSDEGGEFPLKRTKLNRRIKAELINDCFSDAIVYSGRRSADIRKALKESICKDFDGCAPGATLVIVTESLGSKIVMDAVQEMSSAERTALLSATQQLMMLANQLPLLGLATGPDAPDRVTAATSAFADAWKAARRADADALSIVAFTDPNDLLSYRLRPADFPGVGVHNVLTSNTGRILGLVADPNAAHTTYKKNDEVMNLVLCGHMVAACDQLRRTVRPAS